MMFKPASKLEYRHLGALASLILISLLSFQAGVQTNHTISNSWEGFIWGLAHPVIRLPNLAAVVIVGLLSAGVVRGAFLRVAFVFTTVCGTVIHLMHLNLPAAETVNAISLLFFGAMLALPNRPNPLALGVLVVFAGLFSGYVYDKAIETASMTPLFAYLLGLTLSQCVIAMTAREIGNTITIKGVEQFLSRKIRFASLAFCALGILFLGSSVL